MTTGDQPDPRVVALVVDFKLGEMMLSEDQALAILNRSDLADRAAGIRRVTAQQITEHLAAEQERLGWCSGNNEHWHGGMQSAADAVREFFEGGTES